METKELSRGDASAEPDVRFEVAFPERQPGDQDEEWCEVRLNGVRKRIRFHDYHELYSIPGLYEYLFYEKLKCSSPATVCSLLSTLMERDRVEPAELRVLDVGAGNGMVGEELKKLGVGAVTGVDIIEEAAEAAGRDRPGLYDDYMVADLTALTADERARLQRGRFNCLTSVAALGYGDMPPLAFAVAHNLVSDGGWIAYCIKDRFLEDEDSGFSQLVRRMLEEGVMEERARHRYPHRNSVGGDPLHYVAMVAVKRTDVPASWAQALA
ncbi:MAG: class I SAM-dependent methyltransferase [Actinomycetota bacterium]|nr:class I SAM-dependent methyltransferase [Actinomycetota bacterium]